MYNIKAVGKLLRKGKALTVRNKDVPFASLCFTEGACGLQIYLKYGSLLGNVKAVLDRKSVV